MGILLAPDIIGTPVEFVNVGNQERMENYHAVRRRIKTVG